MQLFRGSVHLQPDSVPGFRWHSEKDGKDDKLGDTRRNTDPH